MVLIEIVGFITKNSVKNINRMLDTYSTFDVYGSTKSKTVLFQSRDLDFSMTNDSLKTVQTNIGNIVCIKSFEEVVSRSNTEKNIVIYIRI